MIEESTKDNKQAADDGTATHALIEEEYTGITYDFTDEVRERVAPAVEAAKEVIRVLGIEIIALEYPIWHPDHYYAGTIDLVGRTSYGGGLLVLDWKRAKALYKEHSYQVAAYAKALSKQLVGEPDVAAVVARLPRTPDEDHETRLVNVDNAFNVFLAAKDLHETMAKYPPKQVWEE